MMALQADGAKARVGDERAIGHSHIAQDAEQVRVVGRSRDAVRFVAGLASEGGEGRIGSSSGAHSAALEADKTSRSMTADTHGAIGGAAGNTRGCVGIGMSRDVPFGAFD